MADTTPPVERQRLDKWLWCARFFKTRSLAASTVASGKVRVNGTRVSKPGYGAKVGDVLTFAQAKKIVVVEILNLGERRGPATEAQMLYRRIEDAETGPGSEVHDTAQPPAAAAPLDEDRGAP